MSQSVNHGTLVSYHYQTYGSYAFTLIKYSLVGELSFAKDCRDISMPDLTIINVDKSTGFPIKTLIM